MHSSTGLAIWAGIVKLCSFLTGAMAAAPLPFPSAVEAEMPESDQRAALDSVVDDLEKEASRSTGSTKTGADSGGKNWT
jgi:hypothetical protein